MSIGWDDKKKHHNQDSMWTSYSDLFLGLSVIFLLLYVTASLRQGTDGIKQHIDNQQLTRQNEDLKQQLKVYNSLKQNYLDTEASQDEQKTYEMLMAKLNMLKDEANQEKSKLQKQAEENGQKEQALNQYQQTIRNIINANMLSKSRIKNRDTLITKREDTIEGQTKEITEQQKLLNQKREEIEQGQEKIAQLDSELQKKLKQLKKSYKEKQLTEKIYQKRQEALKKETEKKVAALATKNQKAEQDLASLSQQLNQTSTELQQVGAEKARLENEVGHMKSDFENQKAADRRQFEAQLAKEKLSGAERAKREAQYRAAAAQKEKELGDKISAAEGKYKAAQGDLAKTKGELEKARENLNARKKLADSIQGMFKANGVKAEVDGRTGDVLLSFDGEYFDTGASNLKPGMKNVLEKAMPAYATSLFQDPKIAEKIENVEIVGFASPTYNGKLIDPSKLTGKDRDAVNFNLDLSYGRARAIFDHMLTKMNFEHKQRLLPLVKVTGRSFLADKNDREPTGDSNSVSDFCKKHDCAKQQTVVIKFKLRD